MPDLSAQFAQATQHVAHWFQTMRTPGGYGGPVSHWWQNCLHYAGAGLDWRYEGLMYGYLRLHKLTNDAVWLERALQAGDDLLQGQLPSGNFRNSAFELNPYTGGTPHEAAADLALLILAQHLKAGNQTNWQIYFDAAQRNIHEFYLKRLWHDDNAVFQDHHANLSFVPNKLCTLVEALFSLAQVTGNDEYVIKYALPSLEKVLVTQERNPGREVGAIYQNMHQGKLVLKTFPYYVARCIPALLYAYDWTNQQIYLDAATSAADFVLRWRDDDGGFVQIVYFDGTISRYPRWVAGAADIALRLRALEPYGYSADLTSTDNWILSGVDAHGGVRTGHGFSMKISQGQPSAKPEFRDVMPVCGWADKAFRYLVSQTSADAFAAVDTTSALDVDIACTVRGQDIHYHEDESVIELRQLNGTTIYQWRKGTDWAHIKTPMLLWK